MLVTFTILRYHLDLCHNIFGEGVYPEVDATNVYYGGTKIAGQCIYVSLNNASRKRSLKFRFTCTALILKNPAFLDL